MPTVTGTIRHPVSGALAVGGVAFTLIGEGGLPVEAWDPATGHTIVGRSDVELVAGVYSAVLVSNDDIIPAGTRWLRESRWGDAALYVTATPSTQNEDDILAEVPGELSSAALAAHALDTDLHAGARLFSITKSDGTVSNSTVTPAEIAGLLGTYEVPAESDDTIRLHYHRFTSLGVGTATAGVGANIYGKVAVSDAVRASNVVTATVPAGHGILVGAPIRVDLADNTYDGAFVVTGVTATTVTWAQAAANDPSSGVGSIYVRIGLNFATPVFGGPITLEAPVPNPFWSPAPGGTATVVPMFQSSLGGQNVTLLTGSFFGDPAFSEFYGALA